MFYLFRNSVCLCLCEDKKRLEDMKEDGDVILEHEQWLQPSDLSISSDGESIIVKEITQTVAEIKAQKFAECNNKYSALLENISTAIQQTLARGSDITALQKKYTDTQAEWKAALFVISNS